MTYEEKVLFEEYEKNLPKEADGSPNKDKRKILGVTFEEEYLRTYPFGTLASHVLGFAKADGDGTYGIEQQYNEELTGINGRVYDYYDADLNVKQETVPARDGQIIVSTIDANLQRIVQKHTEAFLDEIGAKNVGVLMMEVNSGEVLAMQSNYSYDLNDPRSLSKWYSEEEIAAMDNDTYLEALYKVWRNFCISDSYEPGSTFKIITSAIALEEGKVSVNDTFSCPGFAIVEDRKIRCHKVKGHGAETFVQGIQNSCNPVFINVGLRVGVDGFYNGMKDLGLMSKTNIDIPGEASTIMHKKETIGPVELATMSFGQSFQITPMQLAVTVSSIINGGTRVTPHFAKEIRNDEGALIKTFDYGSGERIVSEDTSATMRMLLESVVAEGGGSKGQVEGYRIGGKTATSQTLPRSAKQYISSFIGFAPADDPKVLGLVIIAKPTGVYYGGTIAAPVLQSIYANILPYLGIETVETSE